MKQVSILGATGSIGESTLNVIRNNPEKFSVHSVVAQKNVEKMLQICQEFLPTYAVMESKEAALQLEAQIKSRALTTKVLAGEESITEMVAEPTIDLVVAAIVGAKGFLSSWSAVKAGKTILLANKETLVMGGELFMAAVKQYGATILPIDSEHNALFQCLPKTDALEASIIGVDRLILTASGGPFRRYTKEMLASVTVEKALKHPNWQMGPKVTIDSSTLMNKGLELIEAHFLFNLIPSKIEVLIHPESIIHSLVEYKDGSLLAQLGEVDMSIPIAYALGYPERINSGAKKLDLIKVSQLNFEAPDVERFPCLRLAREALMEGASHLVALNAANEVLVEAFLQKKISYMDISRHNEKILNKIQKECLKDPLSLIEFDHIVRKQTKQLIA